MLLQLELAYKAHIGMELAKEILSEVHWDAEEALKAVTAMGYNVKGTEEGCSDDASSPATTSPPATACKNT